MLKPVAMALAAVVLVAGTAGAQVRDPNAPTGPYSPNPPQNTPDLQPPPPCGSATNLARGQAGTSLARGTVAMQAPGNQPKPGAAAPTGALADLQCAAKGPSGQAVPPPSASGPHP